MVHLGESKKKGGFKGKRIGGWRNNSLGSRKSGGRTGEEVVWNLDFEG